MQSCPTVFSQITSVLFPSEFSRCVREYPNRRSTRGFTEYDHFLCLCFGQLTYRESLRDVIGCLQAKPKLAYHLGFRGHISRTNLAYANRNRDWRLFQALAHVLMRRAARLYLCPSDPELPRLAFALDSSIISLSLKLFPWGYYARSSRAAVKLHMLLSLQGNLPAWATITEADFPDQKILQMVPIIPGACYVMDRAYLDFVRLFRLHREGVSFVLRNKQNVKFRIIRRRPVNKTCGLRSDHTVRLSSPWSARSYPEPMRKIRIRDEENKVTLVLLTNRFDLTAETISLLYRKRWQVELFFKWIKQHLRIRGFYGRSLNAVHSQVWSAICAYLMVAIVRKQIKTGKSLNEILQILSVNIFEQVPLAELLADQTAPPANPYTAPQFQNLLQLNDI